MPPVTRVAGLSLAGETVPVGPSRACRDPRISRLAEKPHFSCPYLFMVPSARLAHVEILSRVAGLSRASHAGVLCQVGASPALSRAPPVRRSRLSPPFAASCRRQPRVRRRPVSPSRQALQGHPVRLQHNDSRATAGTRVVVGGGDGEQGEGAGSRAGRRGGRGASEGAGHSHGGRRGFSRR